jgi:hypothetical protein
MDLVTQDSNLEDCGSSVAALSTTLLDTGYEELLEMKSVNCSELKTPPACSEEVEGVAFDPFFKTRGPILRQMTANGLYNNRDITTLTSMAVSSPRIKEILETKVAQWKPGFPLLTMVLQALKEPKESIMDQFFQFVFVMTSEADTSIEEYLSHVAVNLSICKSGRILTKYEVVWTTHPMEKGTKKAEKKAREEKTAFVNLRFSVTQERLYDILTASWEDKQSPSRNYFPGGAKFSKSDMPRHLSDIKAFATRSHQLTQVGHLATIVVDYCLNYFKDNDGEKTLFQFIRELFQSQMKFSGVWWVLENLLRLKIWSTQNKNKDAENTLAMVKRNPHVAIRAISDDMYQYPPEPVRDWAVRFILDNKVGKDSTDYFFAGSVCEKDASIVAFRILSHLYKPIDEKSVDGRFYMLDLKHAAKKEMMEYQAERMKHIGPSHKYALRVDVTRIEIAFDGKDCTMEQVPDVPQVCPSPEDLSRHQDLVEIDFEEGTGEIWDDEKSNESVSNMPSFAEGISDSIIVDASDREKPAGLAADKVFDSLCGMVAAKTGIEEAIDRRFYKDIPSHHDKLQIQGKDIVVDEMETDDSDYALTDDDDDDDDDDEAFCDDNVNFKKTKGVKGKSWLLFVEEVNILNLYFLSVHTTYR